METIFREIEFERVLDQLKIDISKIRIGRANPAILEGVKVDYYGQVLPIKQLANISVPEARQMLVQPWDRNALQPIEKGIRDADLGLSPINEGDKIRISLPELTGERRAELVKLVGRFAEESRIKIRNLREELWKEAQKQEGAGDITQDDKFQFKEKLQKVVSDYNEKIKALSENKEKEILTI